MDEDDDGSQSTMEDISLDVYDTSPASHGETKDTAIHDTLMLFLCVSRQHKQYRALLSGQTTDGNIEQAVAPSLSASSRRRAAGIDTLLAQTQHLDDDQYLSAVYPRDTDAWNHPLSARIIGFLDAGLMGIFPRWSNLRQIMLDIKNKHPSLFESNVQLSLEMHGVPCSETIFPHLSGVDKILKDDNSATCGTKRRLVSSTVPLNYKNSSNVAYMALLSPKDKITLPSNRKVTAIEKWEHKTMFRFYHQADEKMREISEIKTDFQTRFALHYFFYRMMLTVRNTPLALKFSSSVNRRRYHDFCDLQNLAFLTVKLVHQNITQPIAMLEEFQKYVMLHDGMVLAILWEKVIPMMICAYSFCADPPNANSNSGASSSLGAEIARLLFPSENKRLVDQWRSRFCDEMSLESMAQWKNEAAVFNNHFHQFFYKMPGGYYNAHMIQYWEKTRVISVYMLWHTLLRTRCFAGLERLWERFDMEMAGIAAPNAFSSAARRMTNTAPSMANTAPSMANTAPSMANTAPRPGVAHSAPSALSSAEHSDGVPARAKLNPIHFVVLIFDRRTVSVAELYYSLLCLRKRMYDLCGINQERDAYLYTKENVRHDWGKKDHQKSWNARFRARMAGKLLYHRKYEKFMTFQVTHIMDTLFEETMIVAGSHDAQAIYMVLRPQLLALLRSIGIGDMSQWRSPKSIVTVPLFPLLIARCCHQPRVLLEEKYTSNSGVPGIKFEMSSEQESEDDLDNPSIDVGGEHSARLAAVMASALFPESEARTADVDALYWATITNLRGAAFSWAHIAAKMTQQAVVRAANNMLDGHPTRRDCHVLSLHTFENEHYYPYFVQLMDLFDATADASGATRGTSGATDASGATSGASGIIPGVDGVAPSNHSAALKDHIEHAEITVFMTRTWLAAPAGLDITIGHEHHAHFYSIMGAFFAPNRVHYISSRTMVHIYAILQEVDERAREAFFKPLWEIVYHYYVAWSTGKLGPESERDKPLALCHRDNNAFDSGFDPDQNAAFSHDKNTRACYTDNYPRKGYNMLPIEHVQERAYIDSQCLTLDELPDLGVLPVAAKAPAAKAAVADSAKKKKRGRKKKGEMPNLKKEEEKEKAENAEVSPPQEEHYIKTLCPSAVLTLLYSVLLLPPKDAVDLDAFARKMHTNLPLPEPTAKALARSLLNGLYVWPWYAGDKKDCPNLYGVLPEMEYGSPKKERKESLFSHDLVQTLHKNHHRTMYATHDQMANVWLREEMRAMEMVTTSNKDDKKGTQVDKSITRLPSDPLFLADVERMANTLGDDQKNNMMHYKAFLEEYFYQMENVLVDEDIGQPSNLQQQYLQCMHRYLQQMEFMVHFPPVYPEHCSADPESMLENPDTVMANLYEEKSSLKKNNRAAAGRAVHAFDNISFDAMIGEAAARSSPSVQMNKQYFWHLAKNVKAVHNYFHGTAPDSGSVSEATREGSHKDSQNSRGSSSSAKISNLMDIDFCDRRPHAKNFSTVFESNGFPVYSLFSKTQRSNTAMIEAYDFIIDTGTHLPVDFPTEYLNGDSFDSLEGLLAYFNVENTKTNYINVLTRKKPPAAKSTTTTASVATQPASAHTNLPPPVPQMSAVVPPVPQMPAPPTQVPVVPTQALVMPPTQAPMVPPTQAPVGPLMPPTVPPMPPTVPPMPPVVPPMPPVVPPMPPVVLPMPPVVLPSAIPAIPIPRSVPSTGASRRASRTSPRDDDHSDSLEDGEVRESAGGAANTASTYTIRNPSYVSSTDGQNSSLLNFKPISFDYPTSKNSMFASSASPALRSTKTRAHRDICDMMKAVDSSCTPAMLRASKVITENLAFDRMFTRYNEKYLAHLQQK